MLIWYGVGAVAAIFVAWFAALIHASGHAPIGLVSLGVGATLGVILAKLAATLRVAGKKRLVIGAVILSIICILAEHTWLYLDFRRQWHADQAKTPHVAIFRPNTPWSPAQYFAHELTPQQGALWCLDATIIIGIAVTTVLTLRREPRAFSP
jgi:ABC-type uncharacterized transport system permease subunit